ncbi:MAG: DeoR/GlpR transcriptional regulator [Clostridia bacterium]|nr:DeoR/GlpR transcriptional regulator [Clostridia bacterium]
MNSEERKQKILELLNRDGSIRVAVLSKLFNTSEVTIRTDLADMEYKGLLTRVHGGAVSSYKPYYSMNLNQRLTTNHEEKLIIADKIAGMIENNDTVMFNAGTTPLIVFRALPQTLNLNIVTNSIAIALEASEIPNFNIVLLGGETNSKYQFTFGTDACAQLKKYHADKLVLSVDGIDMKTGFSTYYDKEAELDRIMLEQADTRIVAADYSKFNRSAFAKIADIDLADYIVTNRNVSGKLTKDIKKKNVVIV